MNFVNFWMRDIVLPLGATACPLDLPDGEYRLVTADGLGAEATAWEIVGAVVAGGAATLTRGLEGTTDQAWPAGSVIYSSVTAGILQALADNNGDDTVVEHITTDVHLQFFGMPATAPSRVGQLCRQIDVNGLVCEWVAWVDGEEALQWRRSVLPMVGWGLGLPDTISITLDGSARAFAARKDAAASPIVTSLGLPLLAEGDGYEYLQHGPLPIVIGNWSDQPWTVNLDPAAFWQSGGQVDLETAGLEQLGITTSTSGPDDSVISFVVPANTRAWVDLTIETYIADEVFNMYCQLIARPINLSIV